MNIGWGSSGGGGGDYQHPATHPDTMITITDENGNFVGVKLNEVLDELFQSVSNGKIDIEAAIIDKFGTVSKAGSLATFAELVQGIANIPIGDYEIASGVAIPIDGYDFVYENGNANSRAGLEVTGLTFKPTHIFILSTKPSTSEDLTQTATWTNEQVSSYSPAHTIAVVRSYDSATYYRITEIATGNGVGDAHISQGSFCIPAYAAKSSRWVAFGPTPR